MEEASYFTLPEVRFTLLCFLGQDREIQQGPTCWSKNCDNVNANDDFIDEVIQDWKREAPELDTSGLLTAGRIVVLNKHIEKRIDRHLEPFGVQLWGFDVLASLRRSGEPYTQTPKVLMRNCFLTSGAVTNRVNRLEAAGLVLRTADTVDRRSVKVALTAKGKDLVEVAMADRVKHMAGFLNEALTPSDRQTLSALLHKLLLRFEAAELEDPLPTRSPRETRSGSGPG